MDYYKSFNYLLYGMGVSNEAVKKYFDEVGFCYKTYIDQNEMIKVEEILSDVDIIVKSAGVNPKVPLITYALKHGIKVVTDLELFYLLFKPKHIIGITGTNGKTTTAKLISALLSKKYTVHLCGNIGIPIFNKVNTNYQMDYYVIEISSFMLDSVKNLDLEVAVITNISEHHIDWHGSYEEYKKTKLKILSFVNRENGFAVVDGSIDVKESNKKIFKVLKDLNKCMIGNLTILNKTVYLDNRKLFSIDNNTLSASFELYDVLIACFIAINKKVEPVLIGNSIKCFEKEHFRNEIVIENNQFTIINDAKSTNLNSTLSILNYYVNLKKKIILILGGKSSNENYTQLFYLLKTKSFFINKVIVYGELSKKLLTYPEKIKEMFVYKNDLNDSVAYLKSIISNFNGVIIYSPAAQSFDQFKNFEERGVLFNTLIMNNIKNYQLP